MQHAAYTAHNYNISIPVIRRDFTAIVREIRKAATVTINHTQHTHTHSSTQHTNNNQSVCADTRDSTHSTLY